MEQQSSLKALPARLVAGPPPEKQDEKREAAEKPRLKTAEEKASNG